MWIRSSGWVLSSTRPAEGIKYQWSGCGSASSGSGPEFMDPETDSIFEEYYLQTFIVEKESERNSLQSRINDEKRVYFETLSRIRSESNSVLDPIA
jgi:hypothetical protein